MKEHPPTSGVFADHVQELALCQKIARLTRGPHGFYRVASLKEVRLRVGSTTVSSHTRPEVALKATEPLTGVLLPPHAGLSPPGGERKKAVVLSPLGERGFIVGRGEGPSALLPS